MLNSHLGLECASLFLFLQSAGLQKQTRSRMLHSSVPQIIDSSCLAFKRTVNNLIAGQKIIEQKIIIKVHPNWSCDNPHASKVSREVTNLTE
jgi:hypothetical protein